MTVLHIFYIVGYCKILWGVRVCKCSVLWYLDILGYTWNISSSQLFQATQTDTAPQKKTRTSWGMHHSGCRTFPWCRPSWFAWPFCRTRNGPEQAACSWSVWTYTEVSGENPLTYVDLDFSHQKICPVWAPWLNFPPCLRKFGGNTSTHQVQLVPQKDHGT